MSEDEEYYLKRVNELLNILNTRAFFEYIGDGDYYSLGVSALLDSYKREKENNKKLTKEYKERIADNLKYKDFVINCIHKNKIKEKLKYAIEMRDFYLSTEPKHILVTLYNERINLCNELLKED